MRLALEILEKGGMPAFAVVVIVTAYLKFGRLSGSNSETQMTAALKALETRVQINHEAAQESREKLREDVAHLGERVARIEGRLDGF